MTIAYFLINSEMRAEEQVLKDLKALPEVKEAHGVYGVYDMVIKIEGETTEDLKKFMALIDTYLVDYEGKHVQFNIIDSKTLIDAQKHPERYRNLVVRVAGYSALWVELTQEIQDEIIKRTEHTI